MMGKKRRWSDPDGSGFIIVAMVAIVWGVALCSTLIHAMNRDREPCAQAEERTVHLPQFIGSNVIFIPTKIRICVEDKKE